VTALVWASLGVVTLLLIVMTWQLLTHDPATCSVCVDRRARGAVRARLEDAWLP
jgi:hypothetical protein